MDEKNLQINIPIPEYGDYVYYQKPDGKLVQYKLYELIADGGEGKIYRGTGGKVYKIYKPHRLTQNAINKLRAMVEKRPKLSDNICWPESLILEPSDDKIPVGFSMANANAEARDIVTLEHIINNPTYHGKDWNRQDLIHVCINIVELFEQLHKSNILMGDVNPKNILVDKYHKVTFIDVDSYQFENFYCPVGMPEYVSARIHKMGGALSEIARTIEDELFAIITLIYRIIFLNALPFPLDTIDVKDAIKNHRFRFETESTLGDDYYVWKNLNPALRQIFINAFTEGIYATHNQLKDALRELHSFMQKGVVSDDLLLVDFIDEKDFQKSKYKTVICENCGAEFKAINGQSHDMLCQRCIKNRKLNRENIYRLICKNCKKSFTVNPWDSEGIDSSDALCPDCEENPHFPKEGFEKIQNLQASYEAILKNLTTDNAEEDYI